MTTLAYDGKTLAADRQITKGGARWSRTKKIHQLADGRWFAGAGSLDQCIAVRNWLDSGADPDEAPNADEFEALIVDPDGRVFCIGDGLQISEVEAPVAMGSGEQFAMMAMRCGANAREAVERTSEFDTNTCAVVDAVEVKA